MTRFCLGVALLLVPGFSAAESGLTAFSFLQKPLDAAAAGQGSAYAARSGTLGSLQFNPAGLAGSSGRSLGLTFMPAPGDGQFGFVAYGHKIGPGYGVAALQYFNAGTIQLNLSDGTRGTVTAEEDFAPSVAYALEPLPGLSLGAAGKYVHSRLAQSASASALLGDLGALWRTPLPGLWAGAALQHLGPKVKFEEASDPAPRTTRYGISWLLPSVWSGRLDPDHDLTSLDLRFSGDMVHVVHEEPSPRAGFELGLEPLLINRVALRFGWAFNRPAESLAFGFGFSESRWTLDYAFAPSAALAATHQLTLSGRF